MPRVLLLFATGLIVAASAGATAARDTPVNAIRASEVRPVASRNALAWAQRRKTGYDTYVEIGKAKPVKVNTPGTSALPGGISGDTLVIEQWHRGHGDVMFYSLRHKRLFAPPAGVNSRRWNESEPSLSGDWLLFKRANATTKQILLRNVVTGKLIELDRQPVGSAPGTTPLDAEQVNGNFAVWGRFSPLRYDIAAAKSVSVIPSGVAFFEARFYAESVSAAGSTYVAVRRGLSRCAPVAIVRMSAGQVAWLDSVATLPAGFDVGSTYALDEGEKTTIYYSRISCSTGQSDIYKVVDQNPPSAP
jgi:hypothetical protein